MILLFITDGKVLFLQFRFTEIEWKFSKCWIDRIERINRINRIDRIEKIDPLDPINPLNPIDPKPRKNQLDPIDLTLRTNKKKQINSPHINIYLAYQSLF